MCVVSLIHVINIFPLAEELLNYLRNIMYNLISLALSTIFINFIEIIIPPYPLLKDNLYKLC